MGMYNFVPEYAQPIRYIPAFLVYPMYYWIWLCPANRQTICQRSLIGFFRCSTSRQKENPYRLPGLQRNHRRSGRRRCLGIGYHHFNNSCRMRCRPFMLAVRTIHPDRFSGNCTIFALFFGKPVSLPPGFSHLMITAPFH